MKKSGNTPDTDLLLWNISRNDDRDAFRSLFEYYYASLCLFAKRYIEDKATREDIVQDVFFMVWKKRKQIEINTSAKNFLLASVKNNCLNYLRKQEYHQNYQKKIIENPPTYADNTEELYHLQELQDLLSKTLNMLPEEYRIAFVMSRIEGKNSAEIAGVLNVSVRTVERYRNKAIDILKNELKDFLPISVILSLLN